jgi:hypothetical protein
LTVTGFVVQPVVERTTGVAGRDFVVGGAELVAVAGAVVGSVVGSAVAVAGGGVLVAVAGVGPPEQPATTSTVEVISTVNPFMAVASVGVAG